jgi:DNA-binding NtrC family response regulator
MMSASCAALVAEDPRLASAIRDHLKKVCQPTILCPLGAIREHLEANRSSLILVAAASPADAEPIVRLTQEINLRKLPARVVLVVAHRSADPALARLDPYILRRLRWPEDTAFLGPTVKDALGGQRAPRSSSRLWSSTGARADTLEESISRRLLALTPSLAPLVERIALAAAHDVTVLLTGATGTGKTFLARLMHDASPRKEHRFLTVPCGALSANLVESEFFGHVKGAFTGADRAKVGKFAAVGSGTLLLDEIDTLGLEQQAGLLRVIETGEFEPIGSNETHTSSARLIVASNVNLEEAVRRGKFRQDLYYRLNVMSFHLPPLSERIQDIDPLARGLAARFNHKFHKDLFDIAPEAMAALEAFPWPGNLRQLENVVQHAVLVSKGPQLLSRDLPEDVQEFAASIVGADTERKGALSLNREQNERSLIQKALVNNDFHRARTAKALGISRVTLFKKMTRYGLMASAKAGSS